MKTLLIKGGKAIGTIRQEGIVRGGRRVVKAFVALFGRVKPGDILFITGGVGDSARYRASNQAEELALHSFQCSVTVQDNPFLSTYAGKFKIFIFHRVLYTSKVKKLIEKIKSQRKEIIFGTDDLIYDPEYLKFMDSFKKMNAFEKKLYENGVGGEILRDPYVKVCTTTTTYLAEKLKTFGKKVFVSKNRLSDKDVETAEMILKSRSTVKSALGKITLRIGYFSGFKGHDKDFATIENVLISVFEKYSDVKLVLAGPLKIGDKFDRYENRIERLPFVRREKHFENIAKVDINIIPLEKDNPFCEAKSELKFFEAGILKVPSVAVDNQTYRETIEDGVDGYLAVNSDEWKEKLEKLIINPDLRKSMGEKAREKVLREYTNKNSANVEYYKYLRSKL